jgi:phosphatidylglycerol:prolipoprotein diacylglycerol transferase
MRQILFHVPPFGLPLYGYGFMLFLAFFGCLWLAMRLARREGMATTFFQDLTLWLFIGGILGARIAYVIHYWHTFQGNLDQVHKFWDGGLIFYGSIPGALLAYAFFYWKELRQHRVSNWKMLDVVAPCLALGLCLGRLGCLLNGCCYGNVACAECASVTYPLPSTPRYDMVARGYQTPAGFVTDRFARVVAVEPHSAAASAGLEPGDTVVAAGPPGQVKPVADYPALAGVFLPWRRGENVLQLTITAADGTERTLPSFVPRGIGLHPTQVYESISMVLLLFLLLSYYPYKTHDGALMVVFMVGYGVHRFLNEMLRTDTEIVAFGMTLSQNVSIFVLLAAAALAYFVWRRPAIGQDMSDSAPPNATVAASAAETAAQQSASTTST